MDNRNGAFWKQLRDHYQNSGYIPNENDPFDPSQFSLCYDRQPISSNLESGVGSGSLTIGGTDPILHGTPMVYADNVTPQEGWYTVHIKGIFLRTKGGTLPHPNSNGAKYIRVDAEEANLNGAYQEDSGPIIDSGTTDTYLSAALQQPFCDAWKQALGSDAEYNNDPVQMTPDQIRELPTIMVVLRGHISNDAYSTDTPIGMVGHPAHAALFQLSPKENTSNSLSPKDVIIAIPPEHYMEESSKHHGTFTPRIYFTERMGDRSILGSNFIMGHEVLFDNRAGRIGFAESHCDYGRYVVEKGEMMQALVEGEGVSTPSLDGQQQVVGQNVVSDQVVNDVAPVVSAEDQQQVQNTVASSLDAPQTSTSNSQVGLDALATGLVQGNNAPPQEAGGESTLQGGGENSLTASGWSRKTQEGGLRQEIRIPG